MSNIQVLDQITINQIAAGEVVENPASVIKELVENSLDASANDIEIETCGAGLASLSIRDNGHGMDIKDLPLCILRHATSKVRAFNDLSQLNTLGFRGEALPSIASVSKMRIYSATANNDGAMIEIDGGTVHSPEHKARTKGTTVEIRSLFFNVPARKAFQKSALSNKLAIRKTVENLILAAPDVSFSWKDDNRIEISVEKGDLVSRLNLVMGNDFLKNAIKIECQNSHITLLGFLGSPLHHKSTRSDQRLFINGRAIVSPLLAIKIKHAYGHLLPDNRYPSFVLHLTLPADWIDVNVHPQKKEVRLRKEEFILPFISKAIIQALQQPNAFSSNSDPSDPFNLDAMSYIMPFSEKMQSSTLEKGIISEISSSGNDVISWKPSINHSHATDFTSTNAAFSDDTPTKNPISLEKPTSRCSSMFLENIHLVGKIGQFMLVQKNDAFYFIDHDAASHYLIHKSVKESSITIPVQQLLLPIRLELSDKQMLILSNNTAFLHRCGFDIRSFGGRSAVIESLPVFFDPQEVTSLILKILETLGDNDEAIATDNVLFLFAQKKYKHRSSFAASDRAIFLFLLEENMPARNHIGIPICKLITEDMLQKSWLK
ncbi:DNA mismatch repair protein MutL [Candidatus Clavichlamydia salmonicola]|uniref:DNA mismatch repair endonuclease MutL n=1 Tax=Candidatus Clavichlamydia salmonicola TaxID=469812 RepID=UPI0018913421|nr:DNA mismatch repair endonuclease MutL [Candidatus Clavichlamydia salmonicola]MBF5050578.1 DNA mismatch repair protein MutL [Candidatus Clavichlamydia salmonicola]